MFMDVVSFEQGTSEEPIAKGLNRKPGWSFQK